MPSVRDTAGQVPICTLSVATLCIGIQVYVTLFDVPLSNFTIAASNVLYLREYYRIFTSALLHGSLMHIVFNMTSFLSIGANVEGAIGSLALMFTILWSIILSGCTHVTLEWVMTVWVTGDPRYVNQRAVGFSGVIFTLALMESYRSTQPTRPMFGMLQVPTRLYPWVLLVVLSVVLPHISFVGHLSGILVGVMHVYGLTKFVMPSPASTLQRGASGHQGEKYMVDDDAENAAADERRVFDATVVSIFIRMVTNVVGTPRAYSRAFPFMYCAYAAFLIEMEGYDIVRRSVGERHYFIPCPRPTSSDANEVGVSRSLAHRACGPPLASLGTARRSLGAWWHSAIGRVRERNGSTTRDTPEHDVEEGQRFLSSPPRA